MDAAWGDNDWIPTIKSDVVHVEPLKPNVLKEAANNLRDLTKQIAHSPYDPELWLNRSVLLRGLGYPELSVGDAYKARLLIDSAKKGEVSKSHYTAETSTDDPKCVSTDLEVDIWRALIESLHAANACGDSLNLCQNAVEKFPGVPWFHQTLESTKKWHSQRTQRGPESLKDIPPEWARGLHDGGVLLRQYPWMTPDILNRDSRFVIEDARKEVEAVSSKCTIRSTSVPNTRSDPNQSKPDSGVFGLFVTQDIRKHETILVDKTDLCATDSSNCCQNCCDNLPSTADLVMTLPCCGARYCDEQCSARALRSHHGILCGKDFSFIESDDDGGAYRAATGGSIESLFWVRLLGIIVQESAPHPLKTSVLARLTRQYAADFTIGFKISQHIAMPIRILQTLGIDVFANPKFDTWVLHTIRAYCYCNHITAQIHEGKWGPGGGKPLLALMPLYVFLNHSCEPSVGERFPQNGGTMTINAVRDMKAGEEMKIMYLDHIDGYTMTREERQAKMIPWFAGPCKCERCEKEEALEPNSKDSNLAMSNTRV